MLALTNEPITVTLAGRTVKVRKLPFGRQIAIAQAAIVADHIARIQSVSAGLPGGERERTVAAAIAAIPSGVTLDLLAGDWAASYEGGVRLIHEAMLPDQPAITIDEVRDLIGRADKAEVYPVACWISGRKQVAAAGAGEVAEPDGAKKKTIWKRLLRFGGK